MKAWSIVFLVLSLLAPFATRSVFAADMGREGGVLVAKDTAGRIIESGDVEGFRERLRSEGRVVVSVRLNIGPDYEPIRMGSDEEYERKISRSAAEARDQLVKNIGGKGGVEVTHWMQPLPWLVVNIDSSGFNALVSSPIAQMIVESIDMVPFLNYSLPQINAAPLHSAGGTGSGKAVAVIDSGIERNHPMISGAVIAEACFVTPPFYLTYESCPSGYGSTGTGAASPCTSVSKCGHGTHVAGIAAGRLKYYSGAALKGVAPSASIVSVRIAAAKINPASTGVDINYAAVDAAAALTWVYSNRVSFGVASVNMSFGNLGLTSIPANGYCDSTDPATTDAVDLLTGAKIAVVAAAGTHAELWRYPNKIAFPACIGNVISVSSVARDDRFENGASANNAIVGLLAPGGSYPLIYSTSNILSALPGSSYDHLGGTSMAAPHVAGAIAALRSGPWSASSITVAQMLTQLQQTGHLVTKNMDGSNVAYAHKLIDLGAAIASPSTPTYFNVTPAYCYGMNELSWGGSVGSISHYEFQGSSNLSFTSPFTVVPNAYGDITVSGKTYLRVRACSGFSCSAWKTGNVPATYTSGCL